MAHLDFRQIGAHDYAQLFLHLERLGLGAATRAEAFRRMVFNVAAVNCDDHTKNFSLLLPRGGRWRLSPAYDVTHAHAPDSAGTRQHLMAVNGRTTAVTRADVREVGDRFGSDIVAQVLDVVAEWSVFAERAGVPEATTDHVGRDIERWSGPLR